MKSFLSKGKCYS